MRSRLLHGTSTMASCSSRKMLLLSLLTRKGCATGLRVCPCSRSLACSKGSYTRQPRGCALGISTSWWQVPLIQTPSELVEWEVSAKRGTHCSSMRLSWMPSPKSGMLAEPFTWALAWEHVVGLFRTSLSMGAVGLHPRQKKGCDFQDPQGLHPGVPHVPRGAKVHRR